MASIRENRKNGKVVSYRFTACLERNAAGKQVRKYLIQQGMLTPSTKQRLMELEATKEDLEIKIANEKLTKPRISEEFVQMWLEKFRGLDIRKKEHRKLLIDNFVNSILVYNDHIEITFNYKEGCKIIPFEAIQKAASTAMKKAVGSDMESYGGPK